MKVYYDEDGDLDILKGSKVAILGYGIQGQGQAKNLRDSGIDVIIGSRKGEHWNKAMFDGFKVYDIPKAASLADIIFMLVPDNAHQKVFESIKDTFYENSTLVFAHGYSIHFGKVIPPDYVDVIMLAPRMPGKFLRDYYLKGGGVTAYFAVHQNYSGIAKEKGIALAKTIGYTKAGLIESTFEEETVLDLFIEHYTLPLMIRSIKLSFDKLVDMGYQPEMVLMELYASGELGELLIESARKGIFKTWRENASPTCQFGVKHYSEKLIQFGDVVMNIVANIKDGTFSELLDEETKNKYKSLKEYDKKNKESLLEETQEKVNKLIKFRRK